LEKQIIILGWREWVCLPQLHIKRIKAKLDTGARTSALHTTFIEPYMHLGRLWIRFGIHPFQHNRQIKRICTAEVFDQRWITDSGGHRERRYIIQTNLQLGKSLFPIELSLTNRDHLQFRMLIGRIALSKRFAINPVRSYVLGRPARKDKKKTL
jgi:hypothetical protein